jgi:hypothetical protein
VGRHQDRIRDRAFLVITSSNAALRMALGEPLFVQGFAVLNLDGTRRDRMPDESHAREGRAATAMRAPAEHLDSSLARPAVREVNK